jgi:hypothetical protein
LGHAINPEINHKEFSKIFFVPAYNSQFFVPAICLREIKGCKNHKPSPYSFVSAAGTRKNFHWRF